MLPFFHCAHLSPSFVRVVVLNIFSDALYLRVENLKVKFKFVESLVSFIGFRNSGSKFQEEIYMRVCVRACLCVCVYTGTHTHTHTHTHSVLGYLGMRTKCFFIEAFK